MLVDTDKIKDFLLDSSLLDEKTWDQLYQESREKNISIEEEIVGSGKIPEDDFRRVKAYLLGIPFVDLKKEKVERDVLFAIPEPIARKHNIVAFKQTARGLEVAMLEPEDLQAIEFLTKGIGAKILPRLTDVDSIKHLLLQYQKSLKDEFGEIIRKESSLVKDALAEAAKVATGAEEGDLKKLAQDLPIVKIVDTLLAHAVTQKASDIHIEPFEAELVIRYRIDGVLHDAMILPKHIASGITARIKILASLRLDEKRLPQDGRFKITSGGQNVSFRVSILPTYYGEKVVMRLLPDTVSGLTLEQGGFHSLGLERIHEAIRNKTGIILVTGPTGSGKSTTLYTILDLLNHPDVNISTIEDPIEYQMPRINQTQVKPEIGFTFASGLRTLVRQDPDIIMVGEIRDQETANLAINAALTGHLVLSTLHTNSAAGTIPRLMDMGVEPFLLVSTLRVVISQRLVRRLCGIRDGYKLSPGELKKLDEQIDLPPVLKALHEDKIVKPGDDWSEVEFWRPKPSEECADGFSGRIGIHEVLPVSAAIKELILRNEPGDKIEDQAKKEGMMTMAQDGIYKAASGITSVEEVFRVVSE